MSGSRGFPGERASNKSAVENGGFVLSLTKFFGILRVEANIIVYRHEMTCSRCGLSNDPKVRDLE